MREVTTFILDDREFDNLVNQHLKPSVEFNCVAEFEWSNDESHGPYEVHLGDDPLGHPEDDCEDAQKWIRGEEVYGIGPAQLLAELHHRGVIVEGKYLIEVFW